MGLDMSTLVYLPAMDMFARPVTFIPLKSQPGAPSYGGRGYFDTKALAVVGEDNQVYSDQVDYCDIREAEFAVLPLQGDQLSIGPDGNVPSPPPAASPAPGLYEIVDTATNGGGLTTLSIRLVQAIG